MGEEAELTYATQGTYTDWQKYSLMHGVKEQI